MKQAKGLDSGFEKMHEEPYRVLDDFTVIVPSLGRPILAKCLKSIVMGTMLPACIVVVDQGDNFDVTRWIRDVTFEGLDTVHLRSSQKSPASARNEGMKRNSSSPISPTTG